MIALGWTALMVGTLCFLSFGVGIRYYFIKPSRKTLPMYLITEVGIAISLLHLVLLGYNGVWHQRLDAWPLASAIVLYLALISLYWWTLYTVKTQRLAFAYSEDSPRSLITTGPYRHIRHPFYTAYTLCFCATPVALVSWWLLLTTLFMFLVYRQAAIKEERIFAASELASAYSEYTGRAGRFAPRRLPRSGDGLEDAPWKS